MCLEPHVPKRLLDGILSWDDDVRRYRGYEKFKDVLIPYLEEQTKLQEERGITVVNEPNSYPFWRAYVCLKKIEINFNLFIRLYRKKGIILKISLKEKKGGTKFDSKENVLMKI